MSEGIAARQTWLYRHALAWYMEAEAHALPSNEEHEAGDRFAVWYVETYPDEPGADLPGYRIAHDRVYLDGRGAAVAR